MKLKVCGNTSLEQVRTWSAAGVDFAGFIFYPPSPRYVVGKVDAAQLRELPIKKIGVFVNETPGAILETAATYALDMVQLHGNETTADAAVVARVLPVIKVIKAGVQSIAAMQATMDAHAGIATYFLFDTDSKAHGGSGKKFDWQQLEFLQLTLPAFLGGGLLPADATALLALQQRVPMLFCADVNSGFETAPGIKNIEQVKKFKDEIAR